MAFTHADREKRKGRKRRRRAFGLGFVFAIACFLGFNAAMAPVSKSEYCGSECHEMSTAYRSWELSVHGGNKYGYRVECIDCHLPPKDNYFRHIAAKAYAGGKDTYKHHFGDEYSVEDIREKVVRQMPSERCQKCHDDLLARADSQAARTAHLAVADDPKKPENRCVACHEAAGHERNSTLFSP